MHDPAENVDGSLEYPSTISFLDMNRGKESIIFSLAGLKETLRVPLSHSFNLDREITCRKGACWQDKTPAGLLPHFIDQIQAGQGLFFSFIVLPLIERLLHESIITPGQPIPFFINHDSRGTGDDIRGPVTRNESDRAGRPPLDTHHDNHPPSYFLGMLESERTNSFFPLYKVDHTLEVSS